MSQQPRHGWGEPPNSLIHYFGDDRKSLCRRWQFKGPLVELETAPPGCCRECFRLFLIRQAHSDVSMT